MKIKKIILKGTPASPGVAFGKVRILEDSSECHNFKKGEILVTWMTDPLFMPAIGKASAIITDIGGQLCHAAIVARELGIPCIVNSKNGTQILKNGQNIKLDASKGVAYEG